jgi:hypothetical protein
MERLRNPGSAAFPHFASPHAGYALPNLFAQPPHRASTSARGHDKMGFVPAFDAQIPQAANRHAHQLQ